MSYSRKYLQLISLLLLFSANSIIVAAPHNNDNIVEFSLSLQSHLTQFNFTDKTHAVDTDQIGIRWYEFFTQNFYAGLEFGYLDLIQSNNFLSTSQLSSGEFIATSFRFIAIDQPSTSLTFNFYYRYNKTESINSTIKSEFLWYETVVCSELEFHAFKHFGFLVAAEYQDLQGKQREFGNVLEISRFTTNEHLGYRLGINFKPDPTANISLQWLTGYKKGAQIQFIRQF